MDDPTACHAPAAVMIGDSDVVGNGEDRGGAACCRVTNPSATLVDSRFGRVMGSFSQYGGMQRKPVRVRRGPATVTGEHVRHTCHGEPSEAAGRRGRAFDPEARRLSPPVRRSRARTLSEDTHAMQAAQPHRDLCCLPCAR
ncbi:hypothetical protein GCM10010505_10320 [Kitasatospora aburaviensis]